MRGLRRRDFLKGLGALGVASLPAAGACGGRAPGRPNVLLITADDMNWDAPGCYGGPVADATPHIDRLAAEGLAFQRAHVNIAVCMPSRQALMTGRYPHRNGCLAFEDIRADVTTLTEALDEAGYRNGILGKVMDLAPEAKYRWARVVKAGQLGRGRDAGLFHEHALGFMNACTQEGRPFFLMANTHDPHRPFAGSADEAPFFKESLSTIRAPSRAYRPDEIAVPPFLPDLPAVRVELAQYYGSVRRADDAVGEILRALAESGQEENTLVMFLSDNGMAFPFSKTNCYLNSTRVPWIVRWPGHVAAGAVEADHFVSAIDLMPSVLDALGLPQPEGLDGRSFLPLLHGQAQAGRDRIYAVMNAARTNQDYPMRCVQTERFSYIYNDWSDGETSFRNEAQLGLTMAAMRAAAAHDPTVADRVEQFLLREPEELYDVVDDPGALRNLAGGSTGAAPLQALRSDLEAWMARTEDPLLPRYRAFLARRAG